MFDECDLYAMREEMNDALVALELHYGKAPVHDLVRSVAGVEKNADVPDSKIEDGGEEKEKQKPPVPPAVEDIAGDQKHDILCAVGAGEQVIQREYDEQQDEKGGGSENHESLSDANPASLMFK